MSNPLEAWRQLRRQKEAGPSTDKACDQTTPPPANDAGLFDTMLERQTARSPQRRSSRPWRRPGTLPGQPAQPAKPSPDDVSRDLARSFLLDLEDGSS